LIYPAPPRATGTKVSAKTKIKNICTSIENNYAMLYFSLKLDEIASKMTLLDGYLKNMIMFQ